MRTKYLIVILLLVGAVLLRQLKIHYDISFGRANPHVGISVTVFVSWVIILAVVLFVCVDLARHLLWD